ncbi:type II secretory pathway component PulK [Roseimicrobium gellanilyticum]|uniref:Type II secretory pathway component PulK n=1 Tax=Roseimicrobium gellanilyticum TaxID=748857 RepID=A0A366HM07_9BACT|nr:type II secretion system protein GspK [Roseimicrobium gellanilyticum]RBP43960.1 type II secretory pathway component PulK [Roseimicrobium gellanilyticum]
MHFPRHRASSPLAAARGSALLIVLWVVALLSFMVVTALMVVRQDVETAWSRESVQRARQLAEMGIAVAAHPGVKPSDPLLRARVSAQESYETHISTEESRLHINSLLTEERRALLERVFVGWGLPESDAETLVDRMMDWADEDDFQRLKGAEGSHYRDMGIPGRPYNRKLRTVEEMALVSGMEQLTLARPDWQDWVTFHGSGQLDLNEAPAELIAVFTGASLSRAQTLVAQRSGSDGIAHTVDDLPLTSVEEALTMLGVGAEAEALTPLLTVKGSTTRIESTGRIGDYARTVVVVLRKSGGRPQILEWKEMVTDQPSE